MDQLNSLSCLHTNVILTPELKGLRDGEANTCHVLVRIQAPDASAGESADRTPQAIGLVIDRSGSMEGRPLAQAQRCAEYLIGRLRPTDSVSLVVFDSRVQRLWPAVPLGDGDSLRAELAGIHVGGNTNLYGGWREGAESLLEVIGAGMKRIILLSDGRANEGLTDQAEIASRSAAFAARGITTSTYGLGNGFNENLMVGMASAGGGNHYYGDTAEDLMEPFEQELALLGNLCLRDLRIKAWVPDGVEVSMVNLLQAVDGGWRLPDLAWGAEAWAVLKIQVAANCLPGLGDLMTILRVTVEGKSLDGEAVQLEKAGLALPVMGATSHKGLVADELVLRRLAELQAAEMLMRMRERAGAHDWVAVDQMLQDASRVFAGNPWLAAILKAMGAIAQSRSAERVMKESMYSSVKLSRRLSAKAEIAEFQATEGAAEVPAYLRRKIEQGKGSP